MNNTICKFAPLLGATELSLTIALVVFVMLTVMLGAIILLLCISKNFRVFFFRETHDAAHDTTDEPAATADAPPTRLRKTRPRPSKNKLRGAKKPPIFSTAFPRCRSLLSRPSRKRRNLGAKHRKP